MTDSAPAQDDSLQPVSESAAPVAPAAAAGAPAAEPAQGTPAAPAPAQASASESESAPSTRRDGRGRRSAAAGRDGAAAPRGPQRTHPLLEELAALYPHLFGAVFRPLKRGVFQDLLAAHPEKFEREALKAALGIHTRSTRYLQAVAAGEKRHDLAGQPVEAMAPEHVHHALLEVYRRKKARATEDLLPKLRSRMLAAFEASGLTREDYTALVASRDESANAILEEAFAEWAERNARCEALLRAFEASGQTLEAFADMYGMAPRAAGQQIERARRLAAARAQAAAPVPEPVASEEATPGASAAAPQG